MKKKTLKFIVGIGLVVLASSCQKEASYVRNYSKPMNLENPTGVAGGGNIIVEEGMSVKEIVRKIRETQGWKDTIMYPIIWLTPYAYDLSQSKNDIEYSHPDPNYMKFPHAICSMQDKWGWDYYYEYESIGEEAFCSKYLKGKRTLGMKLN